MPASAKWLIKEIRERNGSLVYDVSRNGRAKFYDLDDVEEAVRRIRRARDFGDKDTITVLAEDGHRSKLRT